MQANISKCNSTTKVTAETAFILVSGNVVEKLIVGLLSSTVPICLEGLLSAFGLQKIVYHVEN